MPFYNEEQLLEVICQAEKLLLFGIHEGDTYELVLKRLGEVRMQIETGKVSCHP